MQERKERVMRSPRLDAMGVATLSGLMLRNWEIITTPIITLPSKALARLAADMLEPPSKSRPCIPACCPLTKPRNMEMNVARLATTNA